MTEQRIERLQRISETIGALAVSLANEHGIDDTMIALGNVLLQVGAKKHPHVELVKWWDHQGELLRQSTLGCDVPSGQA
jgi:hypothetical protein